VGLIMAAILMLGGPTNFLSRNNRYYTHFPSSEGLLPGSKAVIGGMQVGVVESVDLDAQTHDVKVAISVVRKYAEWVRKDSTIEIATQGLLGDKFVSISAGTPEQPILDDGAEIEAHQGKSLTEVIGKSDQMVNSLTSITKSLDRILQGFENNGRSDNFFRHMTVAAKNLSEASSKINEGLGDQQFKKVMKNLNATLEKINNGTGTLGALINDPALYYDARALLGGANRNKIVRNLVRKTIKDSEAKEAAEEEAQKK
jgi:phospholipid/cholesterol/gamma-HCH transport system substrate-binding protein